MSIVLLTGGAGGLGQAVTRNLLNGGHRVIATYHPGHERPGHERPGQAWAEETADTKLVTRPIDLLDEVACRTLVRQVVADEGRIDAAVLLVGGFAMGGLAETDFAAIDRMVRLNFQTAYQVARPVFEQMCSQPDGGRIVLIGARPALEPDAARHMVAYSLSKALVLGLSDILNASGREKNVVSTVLVPSVIDTPANREAMPDADPTTWVHPDELAELIQFVSFGPGMMLRQSVLKAYGKA